MPDFQQKDHVTATCPHCHRTFPIEEALAAHYKSALRDELDTHQRTLETKFTAREAALAERERKLEVVRQRENELFRQKMEREKELLASQMKLQFQQDYDAVLAQKSSQLREVEEKLLRLQQAEIENAQLRRALSFQKQELELSFEEKLTEKLKSMESDITRRERTRLEMSITEKEKQLEDQRKMIDALQRRAEQGSVQLQGEAQEIAIAAWLAATFPLDTIEDIRSGVRGADCLQIIHTRETRNCGTIYYESKRTKEFQPAWLDKFKADMLTKGADAGVLVTQAMPSDMPRLGQRNGIRICAFEEFKSLSLILRDMLIRLHFAATAQRNKADKMEQLYGYLTSQEFRLYVETVIEGFSQMQADLQREKNAVHRIWAQREKQIAKVLEGTATMFGAIKGIAGNALPDIDLLELGQGSSE